MEILEIKKIMREKGITQIELAEKSQVPLQTLRKIFSGNTPHPRIDTMRAIEAALGLYEPMELTEDRKAILEAIGDFSDDEMKELKSFIAFIVSKRK